MASQASFTDAAANCGVAGHSRVLGSGNEANTGGVRSTTAIVWLAVLALPHASVAVHVRVIEYWPAHEPGVVRSSNVRRGLASQASFTDAAANCGVAGHSRVLGSGNEANTGGVRSTTVMLWLAVLELPHASVAVHVRVIEYSFAHLPGVRTSRYSSRTSPEQSSFATGVENTGCAGHSRARASPTPLITGARVSCTFTVSAPMLLQPPPLLHSSDNVNVLPQACPACTVTVRPYSEPSMLPPVTDQWYELMPSGPE